jgi:EmrB/QacA subfamily drug resistance transporter
MATAREKRLTLIAAILGSGIVFLDGTVVTIALPALRADLGAGLTGQQWVVEAYLLTLSALLLIGGSLGDLFGLRRIFALGVAGFGVTSLLAAVAPSIELLCVARALQGVCGALLVPSTLALITHVFPESERGKAIGSWTAFGAIAGVLGPFLGGVLIDAVSWRLIFAINIPIVLATIALIARGVPASADTPLGGRIDALGATLGAAALAGPVFALTEQPTRGWGAVVVAPLVAGVLAAIAFIAHEARTRAPMLPLSLFGHRNFTIGNVATLTFYAGLGALTFVLPLFLQQTGGYSAVATGVALLPITLVMFFLSRRFGGLADRIGPRLPMGIGPLVAGAGALLLLRVDRRADYATQLLPALLVFGLGLSITVAPLTSTVLGAVDQDHAGVASGTNNAIARVAGLIAVAALGAIVSAQFAARVDARVPRHGLDAPARAAVVQAKSRPLGGASLNRVTGRERSTLTAAFDDASEQGFHAGIGVAALFIAFGGIVSLVGIRDPRRRVPAKDCPGGALTGASADVARAGRRGVGRHRATEAPAR